MTATARTTRDTPGHARLFVWVGWVLTAIPVLMMMFSASLKFSHGAQIVEFFVGKFGYRESSLTPLGVLEMAVVVVYLVPRTAVFGAILMTGYLGGAVATHLRVGDPFVMPALLGAIAWAGLYLREQRLRQLLPLRRARP